MKLIFEPITPEQQTAVERIRMQCGKNSSAVSFQSIYYWQDVQKLDICITDDFYLVRFREKGESCYYMPVGNRDNIRSLLTSLSANGPFRLFFADQDDVRWLTECFPEQITCRSDRDASEYIYDLNELTALEGHTFAKIRKMIHRIERTYQVEIRQITADNREEMQAVLSSWIEHKPDGASSDLAAAERMILSVGNLSFTGILVYLDGAAAAAAGGFPLSEDYFDMCFVKDNRMENGLGIFARCMLMRCLNGTYRFLNSEEDLGHPGLRALKQSLQPARMIDMWEVFFHGSSNS